MHLRLAVGVLDDEFFRIAIFRQSLRRVRFGIKCFGYALLLHLVILMYVFRHRF